MKSILDRLKEGEVLVCDGAMGTLLQAQGLKPGECPELWCLEHADAVRKIHGEYREAGSDIVETNSFGANSYKLKHYGLETRVAEINRAAASLAREVAGEDCYVFGSIGSTGEFMEPYGTETEEGFYAAFSEQVQALEEGGADAIIIETMTAIEEARVAVRAVKENTKLPAIASFTFDPQAGGGYATMMGVRPDAFAAEAVKAGADIVGTNCGNGIDDMIEIVKAICSAGTGVPVSAMPNAGTPVLENGETVFKETPEMMAGKVALLKQAGASIIGGCCGTTPAHIAAIKRALA